MNFRFPDNHQTATAGSDVSTRARGLRPGWWIVIGLVLLVVLWKGIGLAMMLMSGPPKRPPPPVVVTQVVAADMPIVEHTIGTVIANATVQLSSRVQGQLLKANFQEGDTVKAGQLLFQLDPRPYQAAYSSALATLNSAKAKAARFARLRASNAISPQEADDAQAAYLQAAALAQTARLNLEYTQIRSPIDGKTGPILIQPGNMVMAGAGSSTTAATAVPATTLVVITQIQPVKISFALPQADLPRIQARAQSAGLTASVSNHGGGGAALTVPVDFVGNAVDNRTGTIELRATFQNPHGELVPGQLVDVGVMLDTLRRAIVVPHEAVNLGPNSRYVYLVRDGNAVMVPVTVLNDDGTSAAVSGALKPGDMVITDGQLRVIPGKPVQIGKPARKAD
ncbi:MAG: efflux RND transporter periplasmic adaptor subunit [Alphaproteobacteria bacterium]|nr:efflux RND transporter periplasmic adaptor subunit [Alphaproteobacteria bacterium]